MDLSFLIPSAMRRRVLEYFVTQPTAQIHVRALARELGQAPQLVYRELINMENWGFLFSSKVGNQRIFRLNGRFILLPTIKELFEKLSRANSQKMKIVKVFDWDKMQKEYEKIPVPPSLIPGLRSQRTSPRSYDEEKSLKKKNLP